MSGQHSLDSPLFSVVMPSFNKERSFAACLSSVLNQSISDFELIVIDDGLTDRSVAVAANTNDPRVKLISRENRGVSATRNERPVSSSKCKELRVVCHKVEVGQKELCGAFPTQRFARS